MSSGIRHRLTTEISFGRIGHRYDWPREAPRATLIPQASLLDSFRDFHEPFLNELRHPRHGIRIDLDSGKHAFVSPVVNLRRPPHNSKCTPRFNSQRFGFPLPRYPSYEVLTFASVGLPPTEHISFPPYFSGRAGAGYPPRLAPVHASLSPSRYQRKTRGRADR
jgi:hypothetical protein